MKKILFILFTLFAMSSQVDAQILRAEELEKYAMEKYGRNRQTLWGAVQTLTKKHVAKRHVIVQK